MTTRHVLVVAAQCKAAGPLSRLEQAAQDLHGVLTDPAVGGCHERGGAFPSLLIGDDLKPEDVESALREAVRLAGVDNAVLVIALLGHGFTAPQQTDLHYMVADSTTGSTASAVPVGHLLASAADQPGVEGVIALVDTCRAAGAVPDAGRLAGGVRAGRARLAVLTAAAADEEARDMRLSTTVTHLLRTGLAEAGSMLYVDRVFATALRDRIQGQVVGWNEYDNDPFALEGFWLARNPCVTSVADEIVGPLGRRKLAEAVALWRDRGRLPERLTQAALIELHDFLHTGHAEDETHRHWRFRVSDLVATLLECTRLADLLSRTLSGVLTGDLLRTAGRQATLPLEAAGTAPLRDLLEYAALHPRPGCGPWQSVARLVAAVVHQTEHDREDERLLEWLLRHRVVTDFNDALKEYSARKQRDQVRLVISLAGAWTDWPEEVDAWLVREPGLPQHHRFRCEPAGRAGVAKAIGQALTWAGGLLPASEDLVNVDVAAPAHLLARWHPEEERIGRFLLGAQHTVVTRWSGRMDPGEDNAEINDAARRILGAPTASGTEPVDWIAPSTLHDRAGLEDKLARGGCATAMGVDHHPGDLREVLELLLPYVPIVLWPRAETRPDGNHFRDLVRQQWHTLPDGLAHAYRQRSEPHQDCALCLGDVRAVWHDTTWLDFCRPFENRTVAALEEEQ
ncbi:vWA-MoxR associated conflict system protein [Streptomyces resistomycificus]|uniref:vWA-MoxR associated protein middle region 2 domain-containing protein n=1 Tax=Streptomyces resistomycificus TaxID=67356 RepID=A0A0L8KUB6_9ACTN|nr:hypothetical protein [Streptomyces resistomycificus]KOG29339.1 hypothetical protein ADK37_37160 [Streptomyces resistomycificus]KUO01672.1 hypothetical protein AQJ84_04360 [Streptomyces resistomycificus]